jgi:hypothetical protein
MSVLFKQVIENIGELSSDERALVAHCLISSLESPAEDGVGDAWAALAEKRYLELEAGAVRGATWQEIKNTVKG